jgi:hypothetical protein
MVSTLSFIVEFPPVRELMPPERKCCAGIAPPGMIGSWN